jgi:hypothetical protein
MTIAQLTRGLLLASLCLALGCSWESERKRWNTFTEEAKSDLKTITGTHEYTGFSSRSREIEKSINSHKY